MFVYGEVDHDHGQQKLIKLVKPIRSVIKIIDHKISLIEKRSVTKFVKYMLMLMHVPAHRVIVSLDLIRQPLVGLLNRI